MTESAPILRDREISHLRAVRAVGSSRELLALVERIIAERAAEALRDAADELARKGHRSAVTRLRDMAEGWESA